MSDLCYLSHCDRGLLNLYCLMHLTDSEAAEICNLTLCLTVRADNLSDSEFCHNRVLLAVKYLTHRNTAKACNCIGVTHLGKSGNGSLYKVVRVG